MPKKFPYEKYMAHVVKLTGRYKVPRTGPTAREDSVSLQQ